LALRGAALLAALACTACDPPAQPTRAGNIERVVHFANWDGEIGATTHVDFERATGIRVVPEEIVDNASLQTRLLVRRSQYDVAVPGSNFLGPLIAAGALQPIDKSRLPNWRHLDPRVLAWLDDIDPGNRYSVPYVWGTQAFAYNVAAVRRALGREPPNSWRLLFDPVYVRRLSGCGIAWQDGDGSIMFDLGALALGLNPAAESADELAAIEGAFHTVRNFTRYIDSGGRFRGDLASGAICAATGSSGELAQARDLAREAGTGIDIRYVIPEEGALLWVDLMVVPVDAPHVDAAHQLIDYLLDPKVAATVTNASKFASANRDALEWIEADVRSDPVIYPPGDAYQRLTLVPAESSAYAELRTRAWVRVRTGRKQ
jgi:putrescine transport system substrate-binding protein